MHFWHGIVMFGIDTVKRSVLLLLIELNLICIKGDQAPKGVHPNYVQKEGRSTTNHTQRVPYASKEIEDNPEEAELLAEMIHLITIIVEYHASLNCRMSCLY
jgi:hypothetical protein